MPESALRGRVLTRPAFLASICAGLAVRVALVLVHPLYLTDVSYYDVQAVQHLLRGVDPYGAYYSAPPSLATPGAAEVFAYLPGVFSFIAPAGALSATSLGVVASDLVAALSIRLLGPRGALPSLAYFLFPPVVLFSTYFVNDSLPAIAFAAAAMAAEANGRPNASGVLWGLAFGSSVEAWLAFPFFAAYSLRRGRASPPILAVLTAAAVVLPFLAWSPGAFIHDTLLFQFQRPPVPFLYLGPFGTSLNPSLQGILVSLGSSAPLALRGLLVLVALGALLWRFDWSLRGLALRSAYFSALSLFLLPGVAFWSYFELPLMFFAAWYALRGAERLAKA
ncbi:MAG: hypothetical protein JRM85_03940 [Nitrososphaerota archaeon]|nr:hypothetical protein [Nitrososphaerota archaeon]MDG6919346.1 hypothetical protein [Nitrososphaerota archaeon]MDG6946884.1 hypothetical protein [Nitrososphaerota archaeon]